MMLLFSHAMREGTGAWDARRARTCAGQMPSGESTRTTSPSPSNRDVGDIAHAGTRNHGCAPRLFVRSKSPAVMTVTSPHFLDLNSVANLLIPIECELQTC